MPRIVKESDDEVETKGGRRVRAALNSSVLDSPLRRSTRIKHPTSQDLSSPESVSDVSSIGTTRITKRRTFTGDTGIPEAARNMRVRRNSVASDVSELTETESLPDGPPKRITRRSVATIPSAETPTMLNGRTRRGTRAGSETKSTPPVGRATRRTRASSMEPEIIDEPKNRQVGTPVKSRKRASALPSEPAVAEESEDGRSANVGKSVDKTVYEKDEDESGTSHNTSASLRQNPKVDAIESDEKMEVDESPVKGTEGDTIERSFQETTDSATDISGVSRKLEDSIKIADSPDENVAIHKTPELQILSSPFKDSSYAIENDLSNSSEKQDKSPGNKENEVFNSGDSLIERNVKLPNNDARLFHKKSFSSSLAKIAEKRQSISSDGNYNESKIATKTQEIVGTESAKRPSETVIRKEYLVDECVVVIEPIDINQVDKSIVAQTSVMSEPPETDDDTMPEMDSNPSLVQHQEQQVEASEEASMEDNDDSTNNEDIVGGDSDFKISNVVSMAVHEEKSKNEDEAVKEKEAKTVQSSEPIETIDLESDVAEEEETCTKRSILTAEAIDSQSSIINENPQETEEIFVCDLVKEKSSIVTESPVSGTDVVEASGLSEEQNNDKSVPSRGSPQTPSKKLVGDIEAKSLHKRNEVDPKVEESDNDSEYSGSPAFKDIPADEWTGADTDRMEKNTEDETNSVHSASTERNESECEIELVDKEALQSMEKYVEDKKEAKLDYDTDDTIITQANTETKAMEKKGDEEKEVDNEATAMDLSSEPDEDDGDGASKSPRESSKKRSSLSTPRKSTGANTPLKKKNDSIADTIDVESTMTESPTNEDANVSVKSNKSLRKSPKKRNSSSTGRPKIDDTSESDEETENSEAKTPRTGQNANRKSFVESAKKLDTSKISVSAKNTPSKTETKPSGTPAKRRSSNKFASNHNFNGSDDALDNAEVKNKSQFTSEAGSKQSEVDDPEPFAKLVPEVTSKKHGKSRLSESAVSEDDPSTHAEDSQASPQGANKSISNKSTSKVAGLNSDCEMDDEDSLEKQNNEPSKFECTKVDKNKSQEAQESSDSEIDANTSKRDPVGPKIDEEKLNRSAKQESAKKSTFNRNNSKTAPVSSDSEIDVVDSKKTRASQKNVRRDSKSALIDSDFEADEEEPQRKLNKSKMGSGKKSPIDADKNYSTIAQVNSFSEIMDSSSSDDDSSILIPQFFYDQDSSSSNSSSENDDSSDTIDSDVARDLNLDGKISLEYSDDDVPADDCMATESESSDSDDDGADLMDFVVDDDEDEDDSFEDVATALDAGEDDDSSGSEKKKPRRRIIPRPGGDSDSDESGEEKARAAIYQSDIDKSTTAKTPEKDKKPNKSRDVAEPERQSTDLNVSSKVSAMRNKNLAIQSSTPKGAIRERLSLEKADSPKPATPLSKSLKHADTPTRIEAGQISSAKKLSKPVCETVDTPTKLGSSFKVTKTPKTPGTAAQQLRTSLPTDLKTSARETHLSKKKSPKLSTLHQTMTTPNSESPETRFLMKEKLNDTLPALKLQQRLKKDTLDHLRETAETDEYPTLTDENMDHAAEENASGREEAAVVEPEVENNEKKKKKKRKIAKNTSADPEDECFATLKLGDGVLNKDESTECLEKDPSPKISKKREKKKKTAEMETQEPVESKTEEIPTTNKKKKRKESIEEVQINDTNKKDKKKKKKKQDEILDDIQTTEIIKKDKKREHQKKVKAAEGPITKKKSLRVTEKNVAPDSVDAVIVTEARVAALGDRKKLTDSVKAAVDAKKNKQQLQQATSTREQQRKNETRSVATNAAETSKTNLKRLPDEILESLSDTAERPRKRRKIAKTEKTVPSRTMDGARHQTTSSLRIDDGFVPLSASGGTTRFAVVNLKEATKKSKKAVAAGSFRERMLARNPRQPMSAYLVYQQKQKASGKDRPY